MEIFSVEQVGEEHLQEEVVRDDAGLARTLAREEGETFLRPFFHIYEILFIREAVLVFVIREIHLVNDAGDIGVIDMPANNLFWVSPLAKEGRKGNRDFEVLVDDMRGLLGTRIITRDDAGDRESLEIGARAFCLITTFLRKRTFASLADMFGVEDGLAVANKIESHLSYYTQSVSQTS